MRRVVELMTDVPNGGLVLLAKWLPALFAPLDLMDEGGGWRSAEAGARGPALLQVAATGSGPLDVECLALNNVLCGFEPGRAIASITVTEVEFAAIESMMRGVITRWPALAQASVAAVRESFIQREGRLEQVGTEWQLRVQRKPIDVLVDELPWTFAQVRLPWMGRPIRTLW